MIFGDGVEAAASAAPAEWLAGACSGVWGTVGKLVPSQYPSILRVHAPPSNEDWWSAYRHLFEVIAEVGERHTVADRAWFAVWEGYGFETSTMLYFKPDRLRDVARKALGKQRLRNEDRRRNAAIRDGLRELPRFELPNRTYYLLQGSVAAVTQLEEPGRPEQWHRPDLFWPDDRQWFVATDVDFWSLYIGGDEDFISELARSVPTSSEIVTPHRQLEWEQ